ncbi:MAG: class II aldolase/adducin family protein, partial [Acidobacteria bacterium]|nr:class II aldolase/adducin family protein [Acidobacteriota bacterium]
MPANDPLAALVQLSNRIGQDPRLVQPGGGNTSVKLDDVLLVKGSGTDLRTIGPDGFTRLSLARLAPLAEAESMSDAEMMRFMAGCMLGEGPVPSVETP